MFWVMSVLVYRTVRGERSEKISHGYIMFEHDAETHFVPPPEYTDENPFLPLKHFIYKLPVHSLNKLESLALVSHDLTISPAVGISGWGTSFTAVAPFIRPTNFLFLFESGSTSLTLQFRARLP
jgi:hypothetical protein